MSSIHYQRVLDIVSKVTYKPKTGFTVVSYGGTVLLAHYQTVQDTKTGEVTQHKGRKYYVSPHATDLEIVRTCALAVKVFEEHEINENLKYKGELILNPHPEGART